MQLHQFVRCRPAPPGEAVGGSEVHRHGIPVAVPVQRGHAHMQLPGKDAITASGAILQPAQQSRELLCFRPHPDPLFVRHSGTACQGVVISPGHHLFQRSGSVSLSRIEGHPNARHAGCEQHHCTRKPYALTLPSTALPIRQHRRTPLQTPSPPSPLHSRRVPAVRGLMVSIAGEKDLRRGAAEIAEYPVPRSAVEGRKHDWRR